MKPNQRSHTLSKKWQLSPVVVAVVEAAEAEVVEVAGVTTATKIKIRIILEAEAVPDGTRTKGGVPHRAEAHAILTYRQNSAVNYIGNSGKVLISVWIPPPVPGRMSSPPSPDPTNEVPTSSTAILFQTRCIIHSLIQKYIHLC